MGHNPQSSPTAMPAPLQGAYRKLEFQYIIISSLKGKVAASFASRLKGCDISIATHTPPSASLRSAPSPMWHNPQSSPTAMPAPLQGAYRKLEFQYIIISSLKGKVAASFASRLKGCDISIAMHSPLSVIALRCHLSPRRG